MSSVRFFIDIAAVAVTIVVTVIVAIVPIRIAIKIVYRIIIRISIIIVNKGAACLIQEVFNKLIFIINQNISIKVILNIFTVLVATTDVVCLTILIVIIIIVIIIQ